eukprot:12099623-Alexandrium_andersonii.AAC.2
MASALKEAPGPGRRQGVAVVEAEEEPHRSEWADSAARGGGGRPLAMVSRLRSVSGEKGGAAGKRRKQGERRVYETRMNLVHTAPRRGP